jgi:hypothetical protein
MIKIAIHFMLLIELVNVQSVFWARLLEDFQDVVRRRIAQILRDAPP